MKRLFKLREWLTVDEAQDHLTLVLSEKVVRADILRLALDGHLSLSANFVNHARAHLGRVIPFKDVKWEEFPGISGEPVQIPDAMLIERVEKISDETRFVRFDSDVNSIEGVWDLTMLGSESLDVEHEFQLLNDGPPIELTNLNGTFVSRGDDQWAQLLDRFEDREIDTPDGKKKIRGSFFPAGGLPRDAPLVVRTSALTEFQERLMSPAQTLEVAQGRLSTRERDTLLRIVIGMAVEGYRYDPNASRSPVAKEIEADLAKHGMSVTDDTVRKYLSAAATSVLPRKLS